MMAGGLSPQARGEQTFTTTLEIAEGPIPAGAGGTSRSVCGGRLARAYPRRRGGNLSIETLHLLAQGLSPQARGERAGRAGGRGAVGPIPAGAGGTPLYGE